MQTGIQALNNTAFTNKIGHCSQRRKVMDEKEKNRKHYIDLMRGIAAILVVIQHTFITNAESKGGVFISWFHNPVFFIASGILLYGSLQRQKDTGTLRLYLKQALSLLVPFIIWNIIDALICAAFKKPLFSLASNAAWFLAVLFFAHCFIITIRKVTSPAAILAIFVLLLAGMAVSTFFASFIAKVLTFTCIVYLGYNIERFQISQKVSITLNILLLAAVGGVAAFVILQQFTVADGITTGYRLLINMLAIILSASLMLFSMRNIYGLLAKIPATPFFCLLGQYTMQLYLLPFPLCSVAGLFFSSPWLMFLLSIFGSLLIGILIKNTIIDKILFRPARLFAKK